MPFRYVVGRATAGGNRMALKTSLVPRSTPASFGPWSGLLLLFLLLQRPNGCLRLLDLLLQSLESLF